MSSLMSDSAVVLMSGGPDSFAAAKWAESVGYDTTGLFFDAGHDVAQREYEFFEKQLSHLNIAGDTLQLRETVASLSNLAPGPEHVFKGHGLELFPFSAGIVTSLAVSYATANGMSKIVFGLHGDDFEQSDEYTPDVLSTLVSAASETGLDVEVTLPFETMTKREVVRAARDRNLPVELSWSCTQSNHAHCGQCVQCQQRKEVLGEVAAQDRLLEQTH